jgi:hypothetical protein
MRIELHCANAEPARRLLRRCLAELGIRARVDERIGDFPSPSVVVDGRDVIGRTALTGAACRLDVPTRERVLAALRAAQGRAGGAHG